MKRFNRKYATLKRTGEIKEKLWEQPNMSLSKEPKLPAEILAALKQARRKEGRTPKKIAPQDLAIKHGKYKPGKRVYGQFIVEKLKDTVIISPNLKLSSYEWPHQLTIVVFPRPEHIHVFEEAATITAPGGPSLFNPGAILSFRLNDMHEGLELISSQYHYFVNPTEGAVGGWGGLPKSLHKKYAGARRDAFKHLLDSVKELKVPLIVKNTALRRNKIFEREIRDICRKQNLKIEETPDGLKIIPSGKRKVKPVWKPF